jgi:hypothetical protein
MPPGITLDRKYVYVAALCSLVAVAAVLALYNPWTPLGATLGSARLSHVGLHLAQGAQTYFMMVVSVDNPSRVPVILTFGEITLHVNGTEYPTVPSSHQRSHDLGVMGPNSGIHFLNATTSRFIRYMQLMINQWRPGRR